MFLPKLEQVFDRVFFALALRRPRIAARLAPLYARLIARVDLVGAYGRWSERWEVTDFNAGYVGSYAAWKDGHGPERFDKSDEYERQVRVCRTVVDVLDPLVAARSGALSAVVAGRGDPGL